MVFAKVADPTESEIRTRAAEIRAQWTPLDELSRRGVLVSAFYTHDKHLVPMERRPDGTYQLPCAIDRLSWPRDHA